MKKASTVSQQARIAPGLGRGALALFWCVVGWIFLVTSSPAQLTRVGNTSLNFPQNPAVFGYTVPNAFPGLSFNQALAIVSAPGESDRLFVVEKPGLIKEVANLAGSATSRVFLDLTAKVLPNGEQGLLGLAFHPNFAVNGYFYVFYSTDSATSAGSGVHERVARFTALPAPASNAAILATELVLIDQYDQASNHNGGDLHFGPDGYLYISLGDEGGSWDQWGNSQRIDGDFFSGLLRIDVDLKAGNLVPNSHPAVRPGTYLVPSDNPFVSATSFNGQPVSTNQVRTEFWAIGFRNPWRFSIDAPTGRMFAGDVGQDNQEEIDLITKGGNYGWAYREGRAEGWPNPPAASFVDPLWVPADRSVARSIVGGIVYRGSRWAQLYAKYIFADYVTNRIFAMSFPENSPVEVESILSEGDLSPVAFGTDPSNGDVLIASHGTGSIRRLVYTDQPQGATMPATLSATGAFADVAALTPAAGVVAYAPNVSFWSDHAIKRRWFSVPEVSDKITFAAEGNWTFPAGTVWVKLFDLELVRGDPASAQRLETRFLVKTADGIYGLSYRWNSEQTEATLVGEEGETVSLTINDAGAIRTQQWRFPSRSECLQCHTPVGGYALSFNTAQLNRDHTYDTAAANQLTALANAGYFTGAIPSPSGLRKLAPASDSSVSLEHRVRSYLAANCVQCHQPGGAAQGYWDARIETPTASAGLVNGPLVSAGGDAANRVVVPGDSAHSMLLKRISLRGSTQMPPLGSNELDTQNIALVSEWIASQQAATTAPVITTQPLSQTVNEGSSVTFTAAASGVPAPTFQWRKNGVNISGATTSALTLYSVPASAAGDYTVVATNPVTAVTSTVATLSVTPVSVAPVITTQPLSQTVNEGSSVTFTAAASGVPAPTFQWRKNGVNLDGATTSSLTLEPVQLLHAADYTVVATNSVSAAISAAARLSVTPLGSAPVFTLQPEAQAVTVGASVTFVARAEGSGNVRYQWTKDGAAIQGATADTLVLANVTTGAAGTYVAYAYNHIDVVGSIGATLSVTVSNVAPTILAPPLSQTVGVGEVAIFSVVASGVPAPTFQWRKNGVDLPGATAATLTLNNVQSSDAATYTVVVTNSEAVVTSTGAILTVSATQIPPAFVLQPQSQTVNAGSAVTFSAFADGVPAPTYQWRKNGVAVDLATSSTLTLTNVQPADAASYKVTATNAAGSASSFVAVLTVVNVPVAPVFVVQPEGQGVVAGSVVEFSAVATGSPEPTYQWRRNGVDISGANSATLTLNNVQSNDAATYTAVATNSAGSVASNGAVLNVTAAGSGPVFTLQPQSQTATAGQTVTLGAFAVGEPAPSYQWTKNGVPLGAATGASLYFATVQLSDAGTYRVTATNAYGVSTSNAAVLGVTSGNSAPTIQVQPEGTSVAAGASVVLTVVATADPAPGYQWYKDGIPVVGAGGPSLILSNLSQGGAGAYRVAVTNIAGTILSDAAIVTVSPPVVAPSILVPPRSAAAAQGFPVVFSVVVSGSPTPSIQWLRFGEPIPGAVGDVLRINAVRLDDAGDYTVRAVNSAGSVTSAAARLTVAIPVTESRSVVADFNADGNSDLLWQNQTTGERALWLMRGTSLLAISTLGVFPLEWTVAATGDLNSDGQPDIIWSNSRTGERAAWLMEKTSFLASASFGIFPLEWTVAATGDFDHDRQTDLVWSNSVTGERAIWLMAGTNFKGASTLGIFPLEWTIAAAGDFNGDGETDLVWSNSVTGERAIWMMNGASFGFSASLGFFPLEWTVTGAGDYDGDGRVDLIWSNALTGERALWLMNGTDFKASSSLGIFPLEWSARN